jgi:pyrimidine oxygenase
MADPTSAVNINMGTLVGSYASVARMLDEVAEVDGTEGVLLTFDHFVDGVKLFGERIQPLMRSRIDADTPVASQADAFTHDLAYSD